MNIAIYPGSFDPPTNAHLHLIREAASQCEALVVVIAVNAAKAKTGMFTLEERACMLIESVRGLKNVEVVVSVGELIVDVATRYDADTIVRGVRGHSDFDDELFLATVNKSIEPRVRTVFLSSPQEFMFLASRVIRELYGLEGWERVVKPLVPTAVFRHLIAKRHRWLWELLVVRGALGSEDDFWRHALAPYESPDRHHHDAAHVSEGLTEIDRSSELGYIVADRCSAGFAFVSHDAVNEPGHNDNEERSVEIANALAETFYLPERFNQSSKRLIMITRSHVAESADERLMVCADFAVLGFNDRRFRMYEAGVAAEHGVTVDSPEFREGRSAWVSSFLRAHPDAIFPDLIIESRSGANARANLERSLVRLAD